MMRVEKPKPRSDFRKILGREYFIFKRKLHWFLGGKTFAKPDTQLQLNVSIIKHRSFLLRQLKDVDMYLQHNKITNLRLAIANINGAIIRPGETFSIWQMVGRPSKRKGYLEGLVLHNGQIKKGMGGGLCQLGNLLYWMALHTPLTITERWRHGYDVFPDVNRKIPFACGATLSYNYVDLQLRNDTNQPFQIMLWLDKEYLNGEVRSVAPLSHHYEIVETDHLIQQQFWGGYTRHNKIWKIKTDKATQAETRELVSENHAIMMYNPLLEAKK